MVHAVAGVRTADTSGIGPDSVAELKKAPTITWRDVAAVPYTPLTPPTKYKDLCLLGRILLKN